VIGVIPDCDLVYLLVCFQPFLRKTKFHDVHYIANLLAALYVSQNTDDCWSKNTYQAALSK